MTKASSASNAQLLERSAVRAGARLWPRNPYVEALLMYPRRWVVRVILLWMTLQAVLAAVFFFKEPYYWENRTSYRQALEHSLPIFPAQAPAQMAAVGAVLALFLLPAVVAIAANVRECLTDWRGMVMPRYRAPHVMAGALLTACSIVYVACMFWVMQPYSLVGLLATAACLAFVGGCCAALPPKGVAIVSLAAVATVSIPDVRGWMAYAACGLDETRASLLLLAACAALAGLWTFLALSHRERTPARPDDLMLAEHLVRWRKRAGEDVTVMGLRRRIKLWRLPSSTGLMPQACAAALLILIVILMFSGVDRRQQYAVAIAGPLAATSMMFPVCAVATQWNRRLAGLGYELSRPVTRRRFVRDAGLALAADWGAWWSWLTLAGTAGIVAAVWIMHQQDIRFGANPWADYATGLAYSGAVQIVLFGLTTQAMRFQTTWAVSLTALTSGILCWVPLVFILDRRRVWDPTQTAALIAAVGLAGLLLTADAYRRWLRADIG